MSSASMHLIRIRSYPPYRLWLDGQREVTLQVESPILVRDMWSHLAQLYPRFRELLGHRTDEELSRAILVLQAGRLLGPDDTISPDAAVELLPPIAGGGW